MSLKSIPILLIFIERLAYRVLVQYFFSLLASAVSYANRTSGHLYRIRNASLL